MATVQTVPTLLGQVGFNPQGEYQSERQYMRLDVVTHDGSSYACKKDCQAKPLTNTEYWQLIASKGDAYEVTEEDLQEIAREIQEDASSSFNRNVQAKTTEFNQNALSKTTDFNSNATTKTTEFDTNASTKTTNFNSNATSKTSDFNTNATTKTTDFNSNATTKTSAFDLNATTKTNDFNSNATTNTTTFNNNVTAKIVDFNTNAENKTTSFNSNATTKTTDFNTNAETKTAEFNANFEEKNTMLEKNFNTSNAVIEGSGQVTNALYWNAKRVNKFGGGDITQESTTGAQLFDYSDFYTQKRSNATITGSAKEFTVTRVIKDSIPYTLNFLENTQYTFSGSYSSSSAMFNLRIRYSDNTTTLIKYSVSGVVSKTAFNVASDANKTVTALELILYGGEPTSNITLYDFIINQGTTALPWEKYTGGISSPNPDYEQPVKMLTGEVSVEESNKNWFNATWVNQTRRGVVSKGTSDGLVTVRGTFTSSSTNDFNILDSTTVNFPAGRYIFSITEPLDTTIKFALGISLYGSNGYKNISAGTTKFSMNFPLGIPNIRIYKDGLTSGDTFDFSFKLMIERVDDSISEPTSFVAHEGQTFPLTLPADIYLGDLGTASNFIFKNTKDNPNYNNTLTENAWYWKKGWEKIVLDGTESDWEDRPNYEYADRFVRNNVLHGTNKNILCNYFIYGFITLNTYPYICNNNTQVVINFSEKGTTTLAQFKNWLSNHNLVVCCILSTPEYILIEDTTLNTQLNAMWENMKTYGITNFVITGGDIAGKLDLDYYVDDRVDENGVSVLDKLATLEARVELLEQ